MARHTFLAVPIPEEIQRKIHAFAAEMKQLIPLKKWTSMSDYHITLQFLGDTPPKNADRLIQELENIKMSSFSLSITIVGHFGNPMTPRVLWLGVDRSERLDLLHEQVKQGCQAAGFNVDSRPYRPHITLGKRWGGDSQGKTIEYPPLPTGLKDCSWEVDEIILYEVHPGNEPMYIPSHRFQFKEGTE